MRRTEPPQGLVGGANTRPSLSPPGAARRWFPGRHLIRASARAEPNHLKACCPREHIHFKTIDHQLPTCVQITTNQPFHLNVNHQKTRQACQQRTTVELHPSLHIQALKFVCVATKPEPHCNFHYVHSTTSECFPASVQEPPATHRGGVGSDGGQGLVGCGHTPPGLLPPGATTDRFSGAT